MSASAVICLFVKPPVPGRVKTRLASDVGVEPACWIYVRLVERILAQFRAGGLPWALFYDGDDPEELPKTWRSDAVCCCPQEGDDLGARMQNAFRRLFAAGYSSVLLCGSDVVGLDEPYLRQAAAVLVRAGMVIAPAVDGGYCLIGFTAEHFRPQVFDRIAWSTGEVLAQTLARCREVGLKPLLLDRLRDIDTLADLIQAQQIELLTLVEGDRPPTCEER